MGSLFMGSLLSLYTPTIISYVLRKLVCVKAQMPTSTLTIPLLLFF